MALRPHFARLVLAVALVAGSAWATTPGMETEVRCQGGEAWACVSWGDELHSRGDFSGAKTAYQTACDLSPDAKCLSLGKLLLDLRDYGPAEIPLHLACDAGEVLGCKLLIELYHQRGWPGDATDARLVKAQLSLQLKPLAEFTLWYRPGLSAPGVVAMEESFQPLELGRQLVFGAQAAVNAGASWELNGFVGYQYWLGSWAPYVQLLAGAMPARGRFNVGADAGLKWYPFGAKVCLNAVVGFSIASVLHGGLGVGIDENLFDG